MVATGIDGPPVGQHFDTVSVCFSKGLGAPVGSALGGARTMIKQARRVRKLFGGGMRQAGIIAAGALYALEHHIERLAEDHAHARRMAEAVRKIAGLELVGETVDTNIVIFHVEPTLGTAAEFCERLKAAGLLMLAIGPQQVRAVTHLDVDAAATARACEILAEVAAAKAERQSKKVGG